jgi:hypothetical protein
MIPCRPQHTLKVPCRRHMHAQTCRCQQEWHSSQGTTFSKRGHQASLLKGQNNSTTRTTQITPQSASALLPNTLSSPMAACKSSSLSSHCAYTLLRPCSGSILRIGWQTQTDVTRRASRYTQMSQEGPACRQHTRIHTRPEGVNPIRTGHVSC